MWNLLMHEEVNGGEKETIWLFFDLIFVILVKYVLIIYVDAEKLVDYLFKGGETLFVRFSMLLNNGM